MAALLMTALPVGARLGLADLRLRPSDASVAEEEEEAAEEEDNIRLRRWQPLRRRSLSRACRRCVIDSRRRLQSRMH